MIPRKLLKLLLCTISAMLITSYAGIAQISNSEKLYEDGVYQMEAVGNFEEAVQLFNRIVNEYPADKPVAAKALIMLGLCYERLGNQKAEQTYMQVINKFSDQTVQVAQARERLAQLRQKNTPAGQTIKLDKALSETNSLSPDGTKMAGADFSEGQNIAYYDLYTREVKLVTHHTWYDAWTYHPVWSPDGKEVAYIEAGWQSDAPYSLCVSDLDGNSRLLYGNTNPGSVIFPCEWLPNGEGVVAELADGDNYSLAIISTKDKSLNVLHKFERQNLGIASVSPDSRFIVFTDGERTNRDLKIVNIETREITTFDGNPSDESSPRWSPDGRYIVFKSNRHGDWAIWGMAVKENKPDGPAFMIMAGARDFNLLNWSSVGLAMTRVISSADIYTMPVDPSTGKSLGEPQPIRFTPTGSNYLPIYSHDGKHIAFMAVDKEKGKVSLIIYSTDSSESRKYPLPPKCSTGEIRWTPDNKALGFAGYDSTQKSDLFRMTLEKGEWERWPLEMRSWTRIEWSKDGNSIFFVDNGLSGQPDGIYSRTLEDTVCKRLISTKENEVLRSLRFSPDYSRLAYDLSGSVWFVDMDSGISKRITPECDSMINEIPVLSYHCPAWSPDGKHLMVTRIKTGENGQKFDVLAFDTENGTSETIDLGNSLPKGSQIRNVDWSQDGKSILLGTVSRVFEDHLMKNVIPDNQL